MSNEAAQSSIALDEAITYLTFTMDGESFATEITQVREVLEYRHVTKVPRTPDYMRGVINLRGSVVPVVDLRFQLGMGPTEHTVDTCIVILEIQIDNHPTLLGALTDSVQEVIEFKAEALEPTPRLGTRVNNEFIQAMGKHNDRFVIILDLIRLFSTDQLVEVLERGQLEANKPIEEVVTDDEPAAPVV